VSLKTIESSDPYYIPNSPKYPDVPYAEWKSRIDKVKMLMVEKGIDVLVLFMRNNIRYFFGFQTIHWDIADLQPAIGIIPAVGAPVLITADFLSGNAQAFGWPSAIDIKIYAKSHEVTAQRELPKKIADLLKDMGCEKKTIALEMGGMGYLYIPRPLNDIENFKSALPAATFVNGDEIIWDCRMIKSALEVDRIRQAVQVVTRMHAAIVEGYKPGMAETELEKIIRHVEVDAGDFGGMDNSMSAALLCGKEKEGIIDVMSLDGVMAINKDDYIVADLQHRHKGYWSDIARIFQVAPLTEKMQRNYKLCAEGLDSAASVIKPGLKVNELFKAALSPLEKAGVPAAVEMAGHGIGLDIHEPPMIDASTEMLLREGMVLAVEVWLIDGGWRSTGGGGIFGYEDQFVVTDKGHERISGLDKAITQVLHPII
jgi:Xaa-Pro dipeptidase